MNKKELKEFINANGFFLQINEIEEVKVNELKISENSLVTKFANSIQQDQEHIVVFRGLATQKFATGEESRNYYKIDVAGWDWSNYLKNPQILLMHRSGEPIGKALEIIPKENGIEILYYVDLKTMEEKDAYRVHNGYFSALSTGHITQEMMFENNETGARISIDDFWQLPYKVQKDYTPVVTKAEAVEVSVVSIPSNPDALTHQNALEANFKNFLEKYQLEKNLTKGADEEIGETPKDSKATDPTIEEPENTVEKTVVAENQLKDAEPVNGEDGEGQNKEKKAEAEVEQEVDPEQNAMDQILSNETVKALFNSLSEVALKQKEEIETLKNENANLHKQLDETPVFKAKQLVNRVDKPEPTKPIEGNGSMLGKMLDEKGIKYNLK